MENPVIPAEERTLAALTHLSGLAGYLVPFGGVLVPIVLWIVKSDSRIVSSIAKQALLLNVVAYLALGGCFLLGITIVLLPVAVLLAVIVGIAAIVLPIVGAVRAFDGAYYRYPLVGVSPL